MPNRATVSFSKRLSFVGLNACLCAAGAAAWFVIFPGLPIGFASVVLPLALISALVAVPLHEVVLRSPKHCGRAFALYGAFVATLVLYGLFLGVTEIGMSTSVGRGFSGYLELVRLSLGFGHYLGLPVLVVMGLANQCLSPVLCPRS